MARKLTPKQENFAQKYVECGNATEAYRYAYNCANHKPETVNRSAITSVQNPMISARIKELRGTTSEELLVSDESVLREYARIAGSDIRKIHDEDGNLLPICDLDDATAAAVQSVKVVPKKRADGEIEYVHEIKLWPKTQALDALSKNLGLFEKDNRQKAIKLDVPMDELIERLSELRGFKK